ncbi:MAG: NTP transferase domain-containing protein [Clostridiales bacterium]|nr:NTP transferase domain-containing protein [Clostridiales bacterium]
MKPVTKIQLFDENGEKFFGEGPCRLLEQVEQTGSLRCAAASMEMAYSKALKLVKQAEEALGFPLTQRSVGGKDGGGSTLTPEGREFLHKYEAYRDACVQANRELYANYFPGKTMGCVIMASGLGKRFGGNKLMAEFGGQPMIARILAATDDSFDRRVVVTRHEAVAAYCRARNVEVVLHNLPNRNDTVRLGLEAVGEVDGCMFCPGDQPLLKKETIEALINGWKRESDCIWRPSFEDQPGAPILFPKWAFSELLTLPEGKGGGFLARKYPERVRLHPVRDPYELMDVDTRETLRELSDFLAP